MNDLKQRALRGGVARVLTQVASLALRLGSLMILARILSPKDFGLVGMVTAFTGVFQILRDFGLSAAAIQRHSISEEQSSTLFWINLAAGAGLTIIISVLAPFVALFYHEPRLTPLTIVLGTAFLFNAAGVQHSAVIERQMRFSTLSILDFLSFLISTSIGIIMALAGFEYWALVATSTIYPLIYTSCVWVTTGWIPHRPQRGVGIRSMLHFGSTLTLNGILGYLANNLDKVFLGRFWGEQALGIYGRAYQLINIPPDSITSAAGGVAFSGLSRIQHDPVRLRSYFLKGFMLVLSVTLPVTFVCALFADDIIYVCLGPKWQSAVMVFRLLAPTALTLGILTPLGWFLNAIGNVRRGLNVALVNTPLMIIAYWIGLPHGPVGVAFAFSSMRLLTLIPRAIWLIHGTVISFRDFLMTVSRPLISASAASIPAFGIQLLYSPTLPHILRLATSLAVFSLAYLWMLMYVLGDKAFYLSVIRDIMRGKSIEEPASLSI